MNIYRLKVPVPDYYRAGIFHEEMYAQAEVCPDWHTWMTIANMFDVRDSEYPEYTGSWQDVIQAINFDTASFPRLFGNMYESSSIIEVPKLGKASITVTKITVVPVNNSPERLR